MRDDPYADLWWTEADKPWQFLAWVFDYAGFQREGWGYMSHTTVQLDGSCNGLQHFSAIMRDPRGAASTNLLPSEQPADVYQEVADQTLELLKEDANDNPLARRWLEVGADRKICKRSSDDCTVLWHTPGCTAVHQGTHGGGAPGGYMA